MSLATILSKFLRLTDNQAQGIVALLSVDNRWNEEQTWQEHTFNPAKIKTQKDLIQFLQAIGQTKWFKGHDRSKFSADISDQTKNFYANLFQLSDNVRQ